MWQQKLRWIQHLVHAEDEMMRLDRWLRRQFPSVPQSFLQKQLRKRKIQLQSSSSCNTSSDQTTRANSLLLEGSVVAIDMHLFTFKLRPIEAKTQQVMKREETLMLVKDKMRIKYLRQCLLYQDEHFMILNKPYGLAVQGGTKLMESLDWYLPCIAKSFTSKSYPSQQTKQPTTLKLVHRLDMDTSGVLVLARSRLSAANFSDLLRNGLVQKTYIALVSAPSSSDSTYTSLKEFEGREVKRHVDGKSACTLVEKILQRNDRSEPIGTWLQLRPRTGRKHQLRVHCAQALGTPIVGDIKYGGQPADRLYLHATRIRFPDPFDTGRFIDVSCQMATVDSEWNSRKKSCDDR